MHAKLRERASEGNSVAEPGSRERGRARDGKEREKEKEGEGEGRGGGEGGGEKGMPPQMACLAG